MGWSPICWGQGGGRQSTAVSQQRQLPCRNTELMPLKRTPSPPQVLRSLVFPQGKQAGSSVLSPAHEATLTVFLSRGAFTLCVGDFVPSSWWAQVTAHWGLWGERDFGPYALGGVWRISVGYEKARGESDGPGCLAGQCGQRALPISLLPVAVTHKGPFPRWQARTTKASEAWGRRLLLKASS